MDLMIMKVISRRKTLKNAYMSTEEKRRHLRNLGVIKRMLKNTPSEAYKQ